MERKDRFIRDLLYKIRILEMKIDYLLHNEEIDEDLDIIYGTDYIDFLEEYEDLLDEEIEYYEDFE